MSPIPGQKLIKLSLAIVIASGFFCYLLAAKTAQASYSTSTYNKPFNGTLSAGEWNNLLVDFANTWLPISLVGPVGINTTTPQSGLTVNGPIVGTTISGSFTGTVNAANVSSGPFGSNTFGGDYSFPGNVGIGTTNPQYKLDIVGSANINTNLVVGNYLYLANGKSILWGDSTTFMTGDASSDYIKFVNNSAESMRITSGGNVGLGTTNPAYKLDVNGAGTFNGNIVHGVATPGAGTDAANKTYVDSVVNPGSGQSGYWTLNGTNLYNNAGTNVGIGTANPQSNLDVSSNSPIIRLTDTDGGYHTFEGNAGVLNLSVDAGNAVANSRFMISVDGSEKLRLDSSGNVGIGTTNPNSRLDVRDTQAGGFAGIRVTNLSTTTASTAGILGLLSNGTSAFNLYGDTAVAADSPYNVHLKANQAGASLQFHSAGSATPQMVLNSSGNVGIGTTNPGSILDVVQTTVGRGNIYIRNLAGTGATDDLAFQLRLGTDSGGQDTAAQIIAGKEQNWTSTASTRDGFLAFTTALNGGTVEALRINSAGNVGIGTTAPGANLDIGAVSATLNVGNTGTSKITLASAGNNLYVAGNQFQFNTAQSLGFTFNGGNVGIGLTNPAYKLDVNGVGNFGSNQVHNVATPGTGSDAANKTYVDSAISSGSVTNADTVDNYHASGAANYVTKFNSSNNTLSSSLLYDNGTNVGIGTTAPNAKLDVPAGIAVGYGASSGLNYYVSTTPVGSIYYDASTANQMGLYFKDVFDTANSRAFHFVNANNTEVMRIQYNGNVGIGTTNPVAPLQVGDAAAQNILFNQSTTSQTDFRWATDARVRITTNAKDTFGTGYYAVNGDPGIRLGQSGAGYSYIIGGTNLLLQPSAGNVGIGLTNPAYKLDVAGVGNFGSNQVHNVATPGTGSDAANKTYVDSVVNPGSGQSGYWTLNGANLYNNAGTNVGIGTTAPFTPLHLSGAGGAPSTSGNMNTGFIVSSGAGSAALNMGVVNNGVNSYGWLSSAFENNAGVYRALSLNPNGGNVGIGVTNPGAKLDVSGALKLGNTSDVCDSTKTGTFRYDATSGQSYLCDGTRWLNQKNCGLMADDAGKTYGTVQIGGQCWMAENINIGTMLASGATEPNTSDQVIEKWCYSNDSNNCTLYGGLYNWNEAMRGSKTPGARGICPSGWHIPTDVEYNNLEKTVLGIIASPNAQYVCDFNTVNTNWWWRRCADNNGGDDGLPNGAGKSLKAVGQGSGGGAGNDLAGFNGKLSGYRHTVGSFYNLGGALILWSSTPSGSNAWYRFLFSAYATVVRYADTQAYGFSVRCLRD